MHDLKIAKTVWPNIQGSDEPAWIEELVSVVLWRESESVCVSPTTTESV